MCYMFHIKHTPTVIVNFKRDREEKLGNGEINYVGKQNKCTVNEENNTMSHKNKDLVRFYDIRRTSILL